MAKSWDKKDNSATREKIALRLKFLPKKPVVLDLFCGTGKMYNGAYKGRAVDYHGIDHKKVHDESLCQIEDNESWVKSNNIEKYNCFDIDAYGCPWKLLFTICKKCKQGEIVCYITDGLVLNQKMNGTVTNFVSATEKIPKKFNVPGLNRWYIEIFASMLKKLENKTNVIVKKAVYFHNSKRTVYYWALVILKNANKNKIS